VTLIIDASRSKTPAGRNGNAASAPAAPRPNHHARRRSNQASTAKPTASARYTRRDNVIAA
jgi:hypothetical protein